MTRTQWYSVLRTIAMIFVVAIAWLAPSLGSAEWWGEVVGVDLEVVRQILAAIGVGIVAVVRAKYPDAFERK